MLYSTLRAMSTKVFRPILGTVEGTEYIPVNGPFLIAANHIDYLDGFFITFAILSRTNRMVRFLSETNNYWWTGGATIPVHRDDRAESLGRAERALRRGSIICIFPEGARNSATELLPGKTGLARLALWCNVPVVPIGLVGTSGTSPRESMRTYLMHGNTVKVRIGTPLTFDPVSRDLITKELLENVTTTIMHGVAAVSNKSYTASHE